MKAKKHDRIRLHNNRMRHLGKEVEKLKSDIRGLEIESASIEPEDINDWRSYRKLVNIGGEIFKLKARLMKRRKTLANNIREEDNV